MNAKTETHSIDITDDRITILDLDGHVLGSGRWIRGQVTDCSATLTDDEMEDLETALQDALDDMNPFTPTHTITLDCGESFPVMLVDGSAYTAEEWASDTPADYERQDDGSWTFQGQPLWAGVHEL